MSGVADADFRRWLELHDAEVRAEVADAIEAYADSLHPSNESEVGMDVGFSIAASIAREEGA